MAAMLTLTATALAEVKVAEAFSNHMVLQREKPVSVWGMADADLPFYYVQISPFLYSIRREDIVQKTWIDLPRFWTAQAEAMRQKNTGMVVTTDIPDMLNDITSLQMDCG